MRESNVLEEVKNEDLLFTPTIGMYEINPYNVKLGNEYIRALIATAISIIPRIYGLVGDGSLKITRAFVPSGKIKEEHGDSANAYERKYGQGLAMSFTWDNFHEQIAMKFAMEIFESVFDNKGGMHLVVNPITKELSVYRKMHDSKIYLIVGQDADGKFRRKTIRQNL